MPALTQDRATRRAEGDIFVVPLKAGAVVYAGGMACVDAAGFLVPGGNASAVRCRGVAQHRANNAAGANGAISVDVRAGVFLFDNAVGGDAITQADVLSLCFVLDDQTVAKTIGNGARPVAGQVLGVSADGQVLVRIGDRADSRKLYVPLLVDDLRGAQAKVYRIAAPRAGAVTAIWSTLDAALTVGDATLTSRIGATPITGGLVTISFAGTVAGDVDSANPTAANIVAAGDLITVTVGGTNTAQVATRLLIEITH